MTHKPPQNKDNVGHFRRATQVDALGDSSLNYALVAVAQAVAELLQRTYPADTDSSNHPETNAACTIKPEHIQSAASDRLPSVRDAN